MMIPQDIKCCLFDMDGVLFDSMPLHEKSWKEAFKAVDLEYPTEMLYLNEGRPAFETIDDVFTKLKGVKPDKTLAKEIYANKTKIMNKLPKAGIIEGMDKIIELIAAKNIKMCVVTGSSQTSLLNFISKYYKNAFEGNIICGRDVKNGKPHPEPYLQALEKMQCNPQEAIVIENAPLGVQSAKNAGIFTIAINTGKLKNDSLKNAGADLIMANAKELLNWFRNIP